MHTRTNIVIDNRLMRDALAATGLKTKREVVEECMRQYVQLKRQAEARKLFGTIDWIGDLDEMRRD
jgi:Arc/MetJ family transcription regulator